MVMQTLLLVAWVVAAGPNMVEDNYTTAVKQAAAQKKLLFVDAWAPWCHTCVFMREHVLTRPAFAAFEKDVVFASIDAEKAINATFLEKFPVDVWPTLFFIDPATEKVVFKWIGSADEVQMTALLNAARGGGEADRLMAAGKTDEAAQKYLAAAGSGAGAQARGTLSMLSTLYMARQMEPCVKTAVQQLPALSAPSERLNGVLWGLWCANEAQNFKDRPALTALLVKEGRAALSLDGVLADDVSSLFEALVDERHAAKDEAGAQALALEWLAYLGKQAAAAPNPAARAVFDSHRVAAGLAAKKADALVVPLMRSESELPTDYNPPARLAILYKELGRLDEALAASDRALLKCTQGPRKIRIYETKAAILQQKGDVAARRKVLQEALAYAKALPRAQVPKSRVEALEKQLAGK